MDYQSKYLKYQNKFLSLLNKNGGAEALKPGEFLVNDPRQLNQLENVSVLPMGHHTYYEGKDVYPTVHQSNGVSVQTYPDFSALKSNKTHSQSYTKISDAEMTGSYLSKSKYKSDKECAETCSKSVFCNSFNIKKNGKNKVCEYHSNSSRFVPDNIHVNKGSEYYEKIYN